ncbi:MFS transporter [Microlunatus capsulatus]|uniref:MFS family permease n=1 Tax=Microlunatus capsulatus TaxID=99117 RepID=A0ABS4Z2H5_9ACTN|nr:MFS transporter [Microlunatus capsulatus]MBP2415240.1 MFS family permease [Microlunatus capsulatus]
MTTAPPDRRLRRARAATGALFFTNGALFANLVPRYPEIKADLGLSNAQFGLAVAGFPVGAMLAGLAAGALIRRVGSDRLAVGATLVAALGQLGAGVAPVGVLLAAGLLLAGAMDALADVAQNSQGLRVQRGYGRSILNSLHAIWSVGAVVGGALGALAAGAALPRGLHLGASALLFGGLALLAFRWMLHDDPVEPVQAAPEHPVSRAGRRPGRGRLRLYAALGALVLVGAGGGVIEDSGNSWSAIYLTDVLGASAFVAGTGFIALQGMQCLGRFLGDPLVDRFGQRAVARTGGLVALVGMGSALLVPTLPGTVVGFGLAGLGIATLIPAAMHGADTLPGLAPGTGLTVVSWLLRLGFLLSPPVVGAVADTVSLRVGLLVVPLAGLVVVIAAGVLSGRTARPVLDAEVPEAVATR